MKKNNENNEAFEKDILKKVYGFEAKRTYQTILILWILFVVLQFFIVLIGGILYTTWKEQQTLDLFQLFSEDFEVIKANIVDVLYIFYVESPQMLLFIFASTSLALFVTMLFSIKNFTKIKRKLSAINKFFGKGASK